ncbi:DUF2829 domain-containing protein [Listeria ivanovii]|uniref:DUF2829 domain-containing protein n=1 Tax=Listeria ivanovii TaxID=1638 RepID=UPI00162624A5|nr:DUF2829 domain-containing protein [Listeria ivanovii]MBC2254499.1 DUF2829 domain-containing protein [Listeria ivanovii]
MTFEEILPLIKANRRVIRTGFTGNEKHICLIEKAEFQDEDILPYFLIYVDGEGYSVYIPTICDLLAEDWEEVYD